MSTNRRLTCYSVVILILGTLATAVAAEAPVAVSPGEVARVSTIRDGCPSFSWSAVEGAQGYELVVYRLSEGLEAGLEQAEPLLRESLPGGAFSWTPPMERCLAAAGRYAWFVRAQGEEGPTVWSEPRLFAVASDARGLRLEHALAVLGEYLAGGGSLEALGVRREPAGEEPDAADSGLQEVASRQSRAGARERSPGSPSQPEGVSGPTAVRGDQTDATGTTFGVVGTSASADGAGVGAANLVGGADLVLDGAADGQTDALLTQGGINRPSAGAETFEIANTGGGTVTLFVDGAEVFTAEETLGETCTNGATRMARVCILTAVSGFGNDNGACELFPIENGWRLDIIGGAYCCMDCWE